MEFGEILIVILGIVLSLIGILGCLIPALPGPPLNFVAVLLIHYSGIAEFSTRFLIIFLVLNIAVIIFDYVLPIYGAKFYGASNKGIWGSVLGLIIGILFFPPFGMILGVLIGAIVGELIAGKSESEALRAGFATFVASLFMIIAKLVLAIVMTFYFVKGIL